MVRRASTVSIISNMPSKRPGRCAPEIMGDELAERLFGSAGDGLEMLASGKRKGGSLGSGSAHNSRPGNSAGTIRKTSLVAPLTCPNPYPLSWTTK